MPAKNHLKSEQLEKLKKALKEEDNGDIRERILILLVLNYGKTQSKIAEFLGCSLNKVSYWCVHGDPENLESLKDERMKGNHKKATDKYIEILMDTLVVCKSFSLQLALSSDLNSQDIKLLDYRVR